MGQQGSTTARLRQRVAAFDSGMVRALARWGHPLHRGSLGLLFLWLGTLKIVGFETGSSLLAQTIYWLPADVVLPFLGTWEAAIGIGLLVPPLVRPAVLLLALRLPGIVLALLIHADVSFEHFPFAPTPVGQFLIKDFMLFSAAMVIGGGTRRDEPVGARRNTSDGD